MAVRFTCDRCSAAMVPSEVSTLALRGPIAEVLLRKSAHVCKSCLHLAAAGLGFTVAPLTPEVAEEMDRRRAIEAGAAANTAPPRGRSGKAAS